MDSPLKSPNGNAPVRITLVKDAGHGGRMTRVASWLANVPIAKLVADHLTAPLRARAPDDRPERTARRLIRRQVNRGPTNRDVPIR